MAVVTGLILVFSDGWEFVSFWIIGSLVLYVAIQVLVIGFAAPVTKQLGKLIAETKLSSDEPVPEEQKLLLARANKLYYGATAMGTLLFILMILKPFY